MLMRIPVPCLARRELFHRIEDYAHRVERLAPSPRNPDRFHEDKSEIVEGLIRLAEEARRA